MTNLNLQGQITNSNEVDGGLYIEGEMFNSKKDLDGEMDIITPNAFEMALPEFLSIPLIVEHGQTRKYSKNKIQYENIRYEYLPKDYKMDTPKLLPMSIKVSMIIKDKNVIEDIENGNLSGFSLNWQIIEGRKDLKTGAELYTEIKPTELTLTKNPAKKDCNFQIISNDKMVQEYLAKTWQYEKSNVKIKSVYKNEFNNLFCDVEHLNSKQKSFKIPVENIKSKPILFFKMKSKPKPILFFKMKSVKNPKDLSIDNLDTNSAKLELEKVISNQISQATFDTKTKNWKLKSIENYLNFEGIKKIYDQIIKSTTKLYNNFNGTNYGEKNSPNQISQFRDLFAKITLFGWENVNQNDFDKSVIAKINIPKTYKGIDTTTLENLKNAGKKANLETITQNRQQTIWEATESSLYQETMEELANTDGLDYVGVITAGDNRVGKDHRPNDHKYSKYGANGLNRHSSRRGCRCIYFRGKKAQMLKYGFSKI